MAHKLHIYSWYSVLNHLTLDPPALLFTIESPSIPPSCCFSLLDTHDKASSPIIVSCICRTNLPFLSHSQGSRIRKSSFSYQSLAFKEDIHFHNVSRGMSLKFFLLFCFTFNLAQSRKDSGQVWECDIMNKSLVKCLKNIASNLVFVISQQHDRIQVPQLY